MDFQFGGFLGSNLIDPIEWIKIISDHLLRTFFSRQEVDFRRMNDEWIGKWE